MGKKESSTTDNHVVVDYDNGVDQQHQRAQCDDGANTKEKEGIVLLVLSAFLFSFMGMFLQFTGRMGLPSTELVFIRAVFQSTFVFVGMLVCRVDESQVVENLVQIDKEPFDKETTPEKNTGTTHEETVLRARSPGAIYDTIATTELDQFFKPPPHILPPFVWQRPLGTTPAMRKVVILRGVIGGFGFVNYYYTLSTLPLGDATTLHTIAISHCNDFFGAHFNRRRDKASEHHCCASKRHRGSLSFAPIVFV